MRIRDGIVYLAQPLFGRQTLTGAMVVMTTWIDYTFAEKLTASELGLPEGELPPANVRILIPLNNVLAVVAEREDSNETSQYAPRQFAALESV